MKKVGLLLGLAAMFVVGAIFSVTTDEASARPNYKKEFEKVYPKVKAANKITCNVCHVGKSKKNRNDYGKALAKTLGKKKAKSAEVKKAFKKVEGEGDFGKRLKAGDLPVAPGS